MKNFFLHPEEATAAKAFVEREKHREEEPLPSA